ADPDRLSLNRSEERLAEGGERTQELHRRVRGTQSRTAQKILQIVTGAEGCALTAQQHRPHGLVRLRGTQRAGELLVHEESDRVALLGTVEVHLADTVGARDENRFSHASSLRQRSRACNFTVAMAGAWPTPVRPQGLAGGTPALAGAGRGR